MRIVGTTVKTSTIMALLFCTLAAYQLYVTLVFLKVAVPTVATVTGFRSRSVTYNVDSAYGSRRDSYTSKIPIIKYRTISGNEYELLKPTPYTIYKEGQTIDILYDPNNPEKYYQKSIGAIWGSCILFSFLSSVIFFYRLFVYMKKHRIQRA